MGKLKVVPINGARYIQINEIGNGGMCRVYLGRPVGQIQDVVIRQLRERVNESDTEIETNRKIFLNGIEAHKLVSGDEGGFFPKLYAHSDRATAMEYIRGKTLAEYQRQPEKVVLATAYEMARVLEHFHGAPNGKRKEPVHMDVNPNNIIVRETEGEILVLSDFDLAWLNRRSYPARGRWTAGFASPDQLTGKPTTQADLFSLGSTLYRMLTWETPRHQVYHDGIFGEDLDEYRKDSGKSVLVPQIGDLNPKTKIGQVITTCWSMNGKSYESATHMKEDVADKMRRSKLSARNSKKLISEWAQAC